MAAADAATLSTAGATQTAFKAAVTGFEILSLGAIAGSISVDAMGFGTFHTVNETGNAAVNTLTISNLASGDTINITGANTGAGTTTAGSTGSGSNDTLNFGLSQGTAALVDFGTITTPNVENLAIKMTDSQATPVGYLNTATIADVSLHTLTVTGNSGLNVGTLTGATALTNIDASGVTGAGGLSVTLAADQYATTIVGTAGTGSDTINAAAALAAVTITDNATGTNTITGASGAYVNTITAGNGTNTIVGGAAADVITVGTGISTITGGGGADTINLTAATHGVDTITYTGANQGGAALTITAGGTLATGDAVTNFHIATDVINVHAAVVASTSAVASGTLLNSWSITADSVFIDTATNLGGAAATVANVSALIGTVTAAGATNTGFVAIQTNTASNVWDIFEVITASGVHAGAALATTDTISLVGVINTNGALAAANFTA
ncbi:hypothetical protein GALL_494260 [mine drainage metagenome]|uniref:Uncharacterized protein n=1 Tax=mine drainage metagenome TaxID=410659 RepID=A0A1J5PDY1_9ZZZZ